MGTLIGYFSALRLEFESFSQDREYDIPYSFIFGKKSADNTAEYIYEKFSHITTSDAAAFFSALITGRRDFIPFALQDIIRRSGISHLLALSGFHLSVLLLLCSSIRICISRRISECIFNILIWMYSLWIGFIPSLWRAAFMYSIGTLGTMLTGIKKFSISWSVTAIVFLIIHPRTLYMPGFILSMLALCGVVWGGTLYTQVLLYYFRWMIQCIRAIPCIHNGITHTCNIDVKKILFVYYMIRYLMKYIGISLAVSLGAVATTTLYSFFTFNASYPIGIVVSLFLTPAIILFIFCGIILLALFPIMQMVQYSTILFFIVNGIQHSLGYLLAIISSIITKTLAYGSGVVSITSGKGIGIFYFVIIGLCIPYCVFYYRTHIKK